MEFAKFSLGFLLLFLTNFKYGLSQNKAMGPPVISKNIIRETKPVGSTGRLNCTVANLGTNSVFWTKQPKEATDKTQVISMDTDIQIQNPKDAEGLYKYEIVIHPSQVNTELIYTLTVRRLVEEDDGDYECKIMVQGAPDSTWPHRIGILFVQRPPQILKAQSTSTVTTGVGQSVTLRCHADGRPEPRITWSRNQGTLKDPTDNTQVLRVKNSTYTIHNVTAADRGLYRCMADNNVKPPAKYQVTLLVNYKPVITAFRRHVGQAPDKNLEAEMACKVMGYPDPVVTWWRKLSDKRWQELSDDYKHRIDKLYGHGPNLDVSGSWTALRILRIQAGDFGLYRCQGTNIYGTNTETIKFFLTTTCQGANCRLGYDVRNNNSSGRVTCNLFIIFTILLFYLAH